MAGDAFLKIDGIPGESTDDKHKDWIEVLTYSFGVAQSATVGSTAGARSAERANFSDFSFVKSLDKSSPKLFLFCANGTHIKEMTLQLHRATGDKQKYLEVKLSDNLISSISPSWSPGGLPMESVAVNFGKIEYIYTQTDAKTGKPSGDVKAHWDTNTNKGG
jgi:type VI secretion system secreted protein Hcp